MEEYTAPSAEIPSVPYSEGNSYLARKNALNQLDQDTIQLN
jgi:hypothetical protein